VVALEKAKTEKEAHGLGGSTSRPSSTTCRHRRLRQALPCKMLSTAADLLRTRVIRCSRAIVQRILTDRGSILWPSGAIRV
jgi:hypothetical protein